MKQLTNVDELIGKTIKKTYGLISEEEEIVIIYNDHTFAVFRVLHWGDATGIGMDEHPIDPRLAKQAGLITEEKYDSLMKEERKKYAIEIEETNIELLKRLMEEYPDVVAGR